MEFKQRGPAECRNSATSSPSFISSFTAQCVFEKVFVNDSSSDNKCVELVGSAVCCVNVTRRLVKLERGCEVTASNPDISLLHDSFHNQTRAGY